MLLQSKHKPQYSSLSSAQNNTFSRGVGRGGMDSHRTARVATTTATPMIKIAAITIRILIISIKKKRRRDYHHSAMKLEKEVATPSDLTAAKLINEL
jgi:hypothetical protein